MECLGILCFYLFEIELGKKVVLVEFLYKFVEVFDVLFLMFLSFVEVFEGFLE